MTERVWRSRPDAWGKAVGSALFTEDIYPPGMLYGHVVRSAHARARILRIDLDAARDVDGTIVVLGPNDVPDRRFGIVEADERLLAEDAVRYVGEPVALVAAETRQQARAAASAVRVDYEPLPPAVGIDAARQEDAPTVRSDRPNRDLSSRFRRGDVAKAFHEAPSMVATTICSQRAYQAYIEVRTALAEIDSEERLVVTVTSQAPFQVRKTLSEVFGLPMNQVVVRVPALGGGFGGKLHNGMAPYAAALALATHRPVRVVCEREDDMRSGNPRENSEVVLESAVDSNGRIRGRRAVVDLDCGAYTYDTPFITSLAAMQAGGPYAIEAIEGTAYAVHSNSPPTGSFRGPSGPQMCFANEMHIEEIAERLGMDPIDLRRRNLMRPGTQGPTGQTIESDAATTVLNTGGQLLAEWRAQSQTPTTAGSRVGFGLAFTWWITAPGASSASVRLEDDGTVTVACGATEIGTGAVVSGLRELVSADLGVNADDVRLVSASTDSAPPDFGSEGSRTLYGAGNALLRASAKVRDILADQLADELEVNPADVSFREGKAQVVGSPGTSVPLGELGVRASASSGAVVGTGRFQAPVTEYAEGCAHGMPIAGFNEPTFHCHVAQIELDLGLGQISVIRYAAVHDTGTVVNWPGVKGQIEGGVVQGLGYALFEEMQMSPDGVLQNPGFVDYRVPTVADVPGELIVLPIEDFPSQTGPLGSKGIGEAPVILPAAAIASALYDSTGIRLLELPLSANRVRDALQAHGVAS